MNHPLLSGKAKKDKKKVKKEVITISYQCLSLLDHIVAESIGSYLVERDDGVATLEPTLVQQVLGCLLRVHHYVEQLYNPHPHNTSTLIALMRL